MKTMIRILTALLILNVTSGYAQTINEDRKSDREEKKIELQKQISKLISTKKFTFVADRAFPMGGSSIDLTTNSNYIKFSPGNIESYMPFFGRAYSADYSVDPGLKFEGNPKVFTITKLKKNRGYNIIVKVSLPRDTYDLSLDVGLTGNSILTISSYNRASISYNGQIMPPEESKNKDKDKADLNKL